MFTVQRKCFLPESTAMQVHNSLCCWHVKRGTYAGLHMATETLMCYTFVMQYYAVLYSVMPCYA